MKIRNIIFLIILFVSQFIFSQNLENTKYGTIYKFELKNSPFPHELRKDGHNYKDQFYSAQNHYQDSTVLVFIPNYFKLKDSIDFVFYFHGWYNNIDSALIQFNLIEQFYKSKKNAIFVFPEGPKNSPDSFGGKLEEKNKLSDLVTEIKVELNKIFNSQIKIGKITLAGHSGAYRVIAHLLLHGGLTSKVSNVILFDALYADIEKFSYWIVHNNGKFINIFTENGGTKSESENLMMCLEAWNIDFKLITSDDFSADELKERIIFIKSKLDHNEVIHTKNQFQKFLESSF
ncbi:MAG: hypothetical protein WAR79_13715 [Melioribacteraceae bacterium]